MQYSKESCKDLAFLVPLGLKESDFGTTVPFFVYCNSWKDAECCAMYLQSRVCGSLKKKLIWEHSGMSDKHKQEVRAKKAAERKKHNAPTQRGMSTDEWPRKRLKQLHQPLTVTHHTKSMKYHPHPMNLTTIYLTSTNQIPWHHHVKRPGHRVMLITQTCFIVDI